MDSFINSIIIFSNNTNIFKTLQPRIRIQKSYNCIFRSQSRHKINSGIYTYLSISNCCGKGKSSVLWHSHNIHFHSRDKLKLLHIFKKLCMRKINHFLQNSINSYFHNNSFFFCLKMNIRSS